jgi:PPP family 3-phenylpropionic acid transporter
VTASVWFLPDLKEAIPAHEAKVPVLPVLRQRAVLWFFAAAFFHVLSHIGIYVFFSLYLDSLGYSKTMIGLLWAVSVIVEIGWFFTQSRWLPMLSLTGWLVGVLRSHGAAHGHHGQQRQRAGGAAAGAGAARLHLCHAPHGVHRAAVAPLSRRLRGRGQALYTVIAYGFPGVLGGLAGGVLSSKYGLASVFWSSVATSLIATGCAVKVWRLQHPAVSAPG